jgi:hypothetical protein
MRVPYGVDRRDGSAFTATTVSGRPAVPPGGEIIEVGWFDAADLPPDCPPGAAAAMADALAGRRGVYDER